MKNLGTLREPLQYNLGNRDNLYVGTLREPLQYNRRNIGKLGNLEETLRVPFRNLEGTLTIEPWESNRNLYDVTLGTWTTVTLEPLLGNLGTLTTFTWKTWEPCREPWGTFWEHWGTLLGNLHLGTWEPLRGTWEPWGNAFWSCSGLLRNLYYGWRPQRILLLGN